MAMIQYIDKLMHDWAAWTKVRRDGGLGYPSKAAGCNLMPASGNRGDIVGIDEQSMEIEQIVVRLRLERVDLYKVVDWFYLAGDVTRDRIAKELGCSRDTVYVKLHSVHQFVMTAMEDNEIERQDRAATIREEKYFIKYA
jgi:hypothetical protein